MTQSRLGTDIEADLNAFIHLTVEAWMDGEAIKHNSWGTVVLVAPRPGSDFGCLTRHEFGYTHAEAAHPRSWYVDNADGKNIVCLGTGLDSHEAVRLWQGLVRQLEGAFPWGGAVIDTDYGLIIGTSGFKEDEDILVSRTVRNWIVMMLDREGEDVLTDARDRGEQPNEAGADRFTKLSSGRWADPRGNDHLG